MQVLERSKEEIIAKANRMSDFLKMEYLERCSEKFGDLEILKYCYVELVKLYEGRIMYSDSLRYLAKLQSLITNSNEKFKIYEKEIDLFIKAGSYDNVISSYKNALKMTNEIGGFELRRKIVRMFREEATKFELSNKFASLARLYEKLIPWCSDTERDDIRKRLLVAYKKLGKVRESLELEKRIHR